MIDEAEQIVYHAMHYGWPGKEHQAASCPPSITREKKERVGQGVSVRANSPPPACLPRQPLPFTHWQSNSEET